MSKNLRTTVGVIAIMIAVGFLFLWGASPKLAEETVTVQIFGRGTATSLLAVIYGVPLLSLLGLAYLNFASVLTKKHAVLESELSLGGRNLASSDVAVEAAAVEDQRRSVTTHRLTCPRCLGNISYNVEVRPIVCDTDGLHSWAHASDLRADLQSAGNTADAERLQLLTRSAG